jgi:hypothetical protein
MRRRCNKTGDDREEANDGGRWDGDSGNGEKDIGEIDDVIDDGVVGLVRKVGGGEAESRVGDEESNGEEGKDDADENKRGWRQHEGDNANEDARNGCPLYSTI